MALAGVVPLVFAVVDTAMWSCSQIVFVVLYLFNLNIQLVSVVLLALEYAFNQITSVLYLIGIALTTVLQSLLCSATAFLDMMTSFAEGSAFLLYYAQDGIMLLSSSLMHVVPSTFKGICMLAIWIKEIMVFLAFNILPIIEQTGTFVIAGLKSLISYSAHFTVVVAVSIMTLCTLLIHGLYKLFALTVFTVYSALNTTWQFLIGNTKTYEDNREDIHVSAKGDELLSESDVFWSTHFGDNKIPPVTIYDSLHESLSLIVFQMFDVISYLAICIAVVCAVIAIVTLLYCLYSNAMSSVNALVTLFHRSLFRSERSIIIDTDTIPHHHAVPVASGTLHHNLDDLSDAESEDSVHLAGPPVRVNPEDGVALAGTSAIEQRQIPTTRPRSKVLNILSSAWSEPESPGRLAKDLRRQLEEEHDRRRCVVCQDNEKHILIFPCKHLCICINCVEEIASSRVDRRKCPLCRGRISSYLEVYA